jgi:squalene-associated FAD-dependent desaturase
VSRRQATGRAIALGAFPAGSGEGLRLVVVGGGLAGLTAALAAADAGARVTLLEARTRLGGATFSFRREGLWVDNGQHVFLRCCTAYRALLRRLGTDDRVALQERMSIPVVAPGGALGWLRRSGLPAPLHLAGALARYPHLSVADRAKLAPAALALGRLQPDGDRRSLDRRTFQEWLIEHGQGPAAIERLWDLITLPTLNLPARDASLALAAKVFRTGLLDAADGGDVGYAVTPLSAVHVDPAVRALATAGAAVRTRAPVRAVERAAPIVGPAGNGAGDGRASGSGPAALRVRLDGADLEADTVILAVPPAEADELVATAGGADRGFARLGISPIVNLHVVYDRRVMPFAFAAGVGSPVQWVFDRTATSGLDAGQCLAVSLSGADAEIDEPTGRLRARYLPALADLFPRARAAEVVRFFVTRERAATFRQAAGTAALRPGPRTDVPGLHLAGAWTDTGWPATMEGAVRSGIGAVREVLEGRRVSRALDGWSEAAHAAIPQAVGA